MWRDHPFSQIKKDNKKSSRGGAYRRQGREVGENLKKKRGGGKEV